MVDLISGLANSLVRKMCEGASVIIFAAVPETIRLQRSTRLGDPIGRSSMSRIKHLLLGVVLCPGILWCDSLRLTNQPIHLRSGDTREWRTFPAAHPGRVASIAFQAEPNNTEYTLVLRQRDVKNREWVV